MTISGIRRIPPIFKNLKLKLFQFCRDKVNKIVLQILYVKSLTSQQKWQQKLFTKVKINVKAASEAKNVCNKVVFLISLIISAKKKKKSS